MRNLRKKNQSVNGGKPNKGLLAHSIFNLKPSEQQLEPRDPDKVNTDYIPFGITGGSPNLFPQELVIKFRRSPTFHSIIKSKVNYGVGDGFMFPSETRLSAYIKRINSDGESLLEVYKKVIQDYFLAGNAYVQVVRNKGAISLFHLDFTTVRVAKAKEGERKGFRVSKIWEKGQQAKGYFIPEFELNGTDRISIYHIKEYSPNMFFYGLPDYSMGALYWADIEYRIPKYNIGKFKNDFTVSAILDMYATGMSETEAAEVVSDIKRKFTNAEDDQEQNSKLWVNVYEDEKAKTVLTKMNDGNDGNFMQLQELAVQNLITAHRTSASLSGVKTAGQIGSNQQIRNEFEIFYNTVVKPVQNKVLGVFDILLTELGFGEKLIISTPVPISFLTDLSASESLTINEQRAILGFKAIPGGDVLPTAKPQLNIQKL